MRRTGIALGIAACLVVGVGADDNKKYTIKEVMKQAHGGGQNSLLNKVRNGKATKQEKEKLVELYIGMAANKPDKGDPEGFIKLTDAMVAAAKAAQKGDKASPQLLAKATNCKACHDQYK
jgi:hypothetical protein